MRGEAVPESRADAFADLVLRNVKVSAQVTLGVPVVTDGPYRWVRHPNYAAVVLEGTFNVSLGRRSTGSYMLDGYLDEARISNTAPARACSAWTLACTMASTTSPYSIGRASASVICCNA